ncbi:MAG: SDR family NAD(P)-dependent oxidoreductase [Myxococcales bacterium]
MTETSRQVVLITGASSGIGRALAVGWARRGAITVLTGRHVEALDAVVGEVRGVGGEVFCEAGDMTCEADRVRIVARALAPTGRLDVLVNNAGRGYYGSARTIVPADLEGLFALNTVAPLRLTQLALEGLGQAAEASGHATVVMISSVTGVVAAPRLGAYAASKFALEALSAALRAEIAASGIRVLVVRPGPVDTPFRARATTTDGQPGVRPPGARVQSADEVAELVIRAVVRGDAVLETSAFVKAASFASRLMPSALRWVTRRMAGRSK